MSSTRICLCSFAALLPNTPPANFFFSSWSFNIVSSMLSLTMSLTTLTSSCCPIRCTLSIACSSAAGFHHGSTKYTLDAAVRFIPAPAALRLASSTSGAPGPVDANSLITSVLFFIVIEPSKRKTLKPAALSGSSSKMSIFLNWEKTTDFVKELVLLDAWRSFNRVETLEEIGLSEETAPASTSEGFNGGATKRSDWDKGWRQMGQHGLRCLRVFSMHGWQNMWVHRVIMVLFGGERQTGQSKSSPSSIMDPNFLSRSGFVEISAKVNFPKSFSFTKN